ncbi:GNAT family N-acetyltransferase [Sedimentibacter hydroxybenzoicus DSM 7310]|uniref:GNAT family N-acetyltransferase n=1 Tax=Sedimentibacter hydroxybenzoicus DSM 7310 TaxID=1123245 RepID=A0A974GW87_SEDHY|nr:GNAT family N-acetyltransferase [Sedimentibacter hydroxybenzoicus]NYB74183.1 GNAT family N-acetyltransferase [Sedimentibacter hydroxybenzoicus DSM 7310]
MQNKLSLKKVDENNFIECFNLKLGSGQEKYVSHPIRSLAQAYVYYNQCTPFAIYKQDIIIGYVMVIYDYDEETYNIWHMMIDEKHQGNGYGTTAIDLCIDYIKSKPFGESNIIILTCSIGNNAAIHVYEKFGFTDIGRDDEEITMKLEI